MVCVCVCVCVSLCVWAVMCVCVCVCVCMCVCVCLKKMVDCPCDEERAEDIHLILSLSEVFLV